MSTLITEAERRLLGAMLADRSIDLSESISADDFSNPAYGAVYAAIGYVREKSYRKGPDLSSEVAKIADVPGIDQPVLELMRAEAPDNREHLLSYAGMVKEAAFMREWRELARETLHGDGVILSPEHQRDFELMERKSGERLDLLDRDYTQSTDSGPAPMNDSRTALEEQLVASLLANPEQARTVVEIAPPETLQDFRSRTVYELVASMAWNRDAASDLDLLYQLGRAEQLLVNAGYEKPDYPEPDAAYVQRLRETPTAVHTGTESARAIAAQDARVSAEYSTALSPFEHDLTATQNLNLGTTAPGPQATETHLPGHGGGLR
ncbi:DnaB-like helicase N-terminal domain-containing protein [Glycomyces sp. NPDC048151]|uniref:DnaB-like helicase N-terminal domain-containing protein n=1 Tax=Glycomyces sp. NPDC048151 TaxID=3364002 RepID=UPI003718C727